MESRMIWLWAMGQNPGTLVNPRIRKEKQNLKDLKEK
jgi:hypothetical protein